MSSNTLSDGDKKKVEAELAEIEKKIEEMRKKKIELNSLLAGMDVKDYTLKDREGKDVRLSEMFGENNYLILSHPK